MKELNIRNPLKLALVILIALSIVNHLVVAALSKTSFQTNEYDPDKSPMNKLPGGFRTDVAIVYMNDFRQDIFSAVRNWKINEYEVWVMVSASHDWTGGYVEGAFDGLTHYDEVQTYADGRMARIGRGYYMVPTEGWTTYIQYLIEKALKADVDGVVLEEPEFWVDAFYSEAFEKYLPIFYEASPSQEGNQLMNEITGSLMAKLYLELERNIFNYVKMLNPNVKTFLALHSPLNYAEWGISTPYAMTLDIQSLDGYIAQVWSDTARTPIYGTTALFEHAYLEYTYFENLVEGTGKTLILLMDPKSDDPDYTWDDYRKWYEETVVAALMINSTWFELLPWPERVFGDPTIPRNYVVELVNVFKVLSIIPSLEREGSIIGIPISDSYLWARDLPPQGVYLLALPLMAHGYWVQIFPIEKIVDPAFLKKFTAIILNYELWKSTDISIIDMLSQWVKEGGILFYVGDVTSKEAQESLLHLLRGVNIDCSQLAYSKCVIAVDEEVAYLCGNSLSEPLVKTWDAVTEMKSLFGDSLNDSSSPTGKARVGRSLGVQPEGAMVYGPYIDLPSGNYTVGFLLKVDDNERQAKVATLDVSTDVGQNILSKMDIYSTDFNEKGVYYWFNLPFILNRPARNVEFRVWFNPGVADLYVSQVRLIRVQDYEFLSVECNGVEPLYIGDGDLKVVFQKRHGEGLFIFIGVPLHSIIPPPNLYDNVAARIASLLLRRAGVLPEAESILIVRRGPLTALYTYGEARLTGEFIDL
ncbi:hypothetical protein KEJ25_04965, partial [Candidatus Bathyarchaeota archaeon]|nr:hypothetical protein [Candidatus Bathyarchaeota archaeon]